MTTKNKKNSAEVNTKEKAKAATKTKATKAPAKKETKAPAKKETKAPAKKANAAPKATEKAAPPAKAERDAFGGLVGSRCSTINQAVIAAGAKGATVKEIAAETKIDAGLVSAQLSWMFKPKAVLTRKKDGESSRLFRYFAKEQA